MKNVYLVREEKTIFATDQYTEIVGAFKSKKKMERFLETNYPVDHRLMVSSDGSYTTCTTIFPAIKYVFTYVDDLAKVRLDDLKVISVDVVPVIG